jgi:hypothetical protein
MFIYLLLKRDFILSTPTVTYAHWLSMFSAGFSAGVGR